MIVDLWMTHDPFSIDPTTSVSEAALLMAHRHVRRLLVVDRSHGKARLIGIVSAGDVARAFPPDLNPASAAVSEGDVPRPVAGIMARNVRTIAAGSAIGEAARVMQAHKIGALPVMQGERLAGIVTESDIFRAFVEMHDAGASGVGVTFDLDEDEDEDVTATMVDLCRMHQIRVSSILSFHHRDPQSGDRRRLGVVRLAGIVPAGLLDAISASRHRVLAVIREPPAVPGSSFGHGAPGSDS
jgi:acetoin utilization protein AcuB